MPPQQTDKKQSAEASGTIKITDTNSLADIYGMYGTDTANIYNSFAYNNSDGGLSNPTNSNATAVIDITKSETGHGTITGISGSGFIYNAYANTDNGSAANVSSNAEIKITNNGSGDVIGICKMVRIKKSTMRWHL